MTRFLALLAVLLPFASTALAYSLQDGDGAFYCTNKEKCCRPLAASKK
jgi:hypothetical protein